MNVNINAIEGMDGLMWTNNGNGSQGFAYSPFGSTVARNDGDCLLPGFNGERLDPVSQTYHLGNGYRTYNPTLMRFNAPDSWSPFGSGGINQYAYCEGDPINRSDPSGHMSSGAAMGIGIGLGILGLLGAVFTFGQSIAAAAAAEAALTASMAADLLATGLGGAASVMNIASTATQNSDPEASRILGWVSFGLGIASFATHTANSIESKFKGRSGSYDLLSHGDTATSVSEPEAMGWNFENVVSLRKQMYTFEDKRWGRRRLNVRSHGGLGPDGVGKLVDEGKVFDERQLLDLLLKKGIDYRDFDEIRIIACYSADGGRESFGQTLSNLTHKSVKAYRGAVFSSDIEGLRDCIKQGGDRGVEHFFHRNDAPVSKVNKFAKGSENWRNFSYKPVTFNKMISTEL